MQCIQGKNTNKYNICWAGNGKSFYELYNICQFIPYAKGFNSEGWIKYHIPKQMEDDKTYFFVLKKEFKQLKSDSLPEIWCINLERRPDRKEKMIKSGHAINFFKAVDGKELTMTDQIKTMFKNNDFKWRRAIIGVALSHYNLWLQLLNSERESYLIVEDDVEFCDDFKNKLSHAYAQLEGKDWDMLYLGFSMFQEDRNPFEPDFWNDDYPDVNPWDKFFFGAGFFGYVISRQGAQKLVSFIQQHGVLRAIDCIPKQLLYFNRFFTLPHLIRTPCYDPIINKNVDTDIQTDKSTLI